MSQANEETRTLPHEAIKPAAQWVVFEINSGIIDWYDTEEEALKVAEDELEDIRREAEDFEWPEDMYICVLKVTHATKERVIRQEGVHFAQWPSEFDLVEVEK